MTNKESTKDGLVEKSSGRKIESPLDTLNKSETGVKPLIKCSSHNYTDARNKTGCPILYCTKCGVTIDL